MEQKSGMAQFSREELKDLFRLYDGEGCQTHDLLCCECGGRGTPITSDTDDRIASPDPDNKSTSSPFYLENDDSQEDEDIDLPDLPTLMKASEVDIETQEVQIRRGTHALQRKGSKNKNKKKGTNNQSKMQQFLAQYSHIDPTAFGRPEEESLDLTSQIGDQVLLSLLKDDDHGVGFIFGKTVFPAPVSPWEST
jgi:DNA repair and recombination protein RAD54B